MRILDVLLHGQEELAAGLEQRGVEVIRADIRDAEARRAAVDGVDEVVRLAAIVGDPAYARDPEASQAVNVDGSAALLEDVEQAAVKRWSSPRRARTTAAWPTRPCPSPRRASSRRSRSTPSRRSGSSRRCYEFARDLWADRDLEVFGEQFWRPYVHVRDAGRMIRTSSPASSRRAIRSGKSTCSPGVRYLWISGENT